jgi:hypothetical protein
LLCIWAKLPPDSSTIVYHHWFDLNTGKRLIDHAKGIRKSCPGTAFFGGNQISHAEANFIPLIVNRIKNINKAEVVIIMSKYFGDITANHWGAKNTDSLYEKNIVAGKGNGMLSPNDPITRIEAVALIDRAIDYVLKEMAK